MISAGKFCENDGALVFPAAQVFFVGRGKNIFDIFFQNMGYRTSRTHISKAYRNGRKGFYYADIYDPMKVRSSFFH